MFGWLDALFRGGVEDRLVRGGGGGVGDGGGTGEGTARCGGWPQTGRPKSPASIPGVLESHKSMEGPYPIRT